MAAFTCWRCIIMPRKSFVASMRNVRAERWSRPLPLAGAARGPTAINPISTHTTAFPIESMLTTLALLLRVLRA
jgi:hypothetical protein